MQQTLLKIYLEEKNNLSEYEEGELEVRFGTRGIRQITKIDHSVSSAKWTTNIETVMRIRKERKKALNT